MTGDVLQALEKRYGATNLHSSHTEADFLHEFGNGGVALLYVELFVPEFVEIDDSVSSKRSVDGASEGFLLSKRKQELSLAEIEASFNFIEVPYLFSDRNSSPEEDQLLARAISEAWKSRLAYLYPRRQFTVQVLTPEDTGSVVGVCFFEDRRPE